MATNLRLRPDAADAIRRESERSGRSQQDVIREAVDKFLSLSPTRPVGDQVDVNVMAGAVQPPRTPYRRPAQRLILPPGVTSLDLLDRDDRY